MCSQLVELFGSDDDGVLAGHGDHAAVVVPECVLHARHLEKPKTEKHQNTAHDNFMFDKSNYDSRRDIL